MGCGKVMMTRSVGLERERRHSGARWIIISNKNREYALGSFHRNNILRTVHNYDLILPKMNSQHLIRYCDSFSKNVLRKCQSPLNIFRFWWNAINHTHRIKVPKCSYTKLIVLFRETSHPYNIWLNFDQYWCAYGQKTS